MCLGFAKASSEVLAYLIMQFQKFLEIQFNYSSEDVHGSPVTSLC